jgi:Uri superfamily endonuclease
VTFERHHMTGLSHLKGIDIKQAADNCVRAVFDPPLAEWPGAGVYQLRVHLGSAIRVTVGRLGRFVFPEGTYIYTGRASRGLCARVLRHVDGGHRRHWHIDHFLVHPHVRVEHVVLASPDPEAECTVNQATGVDAITVVPGFGSSDCRHGCPAHLWLKSTGPS